LSITADVLDNMMTVGFLASVMTEALASKSPVKPPAMTSALSLMMAS
jgi:hypothetical protein